MNARRLWVAVMGAWMGMAGVEHGIGEILQGSVKPAGLMILSWPESAFFKSLGGEPAMTIVPNLFITGLLAVFFSLMFAGCSIFFAHRRQGGFIMMLLAIPMLLFGGGIFPPVLGALVGAGAAGLHARTASPHVTGLRRLLGQHWRWTFACCCVSWLALLPGVAVLDTFFGVNDEGITLAIMAAAFSLLFLAYWSGIQFDRLSSSSPA
jgi:hypothetical protein